MMGSDLPNFRPIRGTGSMERELCASFVRAKAEECESLARRGIDPEGSHLLAHRLVCIADSFDAGLHR